MKCSNCKAEISTDSRFCPRCGTKVDAAPDAGPSTTRSLSPSKGGREPGSLVGRRYRIVAAAGEGGMGVVYKAEDTKLGRTVALKFLPSAIALDADAKMRFLREAQAAAILDHPSICPVYEIDEADGEMYLTMAFIEGRSLRDRIAEGRLPLVEAVSIAVQVAEGLKAAHERGVVHRDIKPANIMIGREGQVRITDFGLAWLEGGVGLTRPQTVLGTPAYMSPEQFRGDRTDGRTDVWSFGCTLFEMATGRRPFAGETTQDIRGAVLNDAPTAPGSLRADIPSALTEIILRCLKKDPAGRFPDFEAVLAALRSADVPRPGGRPDEAAPAPEERPSVAVLSFVDMSPSKDQDYFGEGLAEELIHALARARGLRVAARTSAFALKGLKLDVREIGRMLGVRSILEGSVRKSGHRLRVTAQLIDAATGMHLWSERFDREERDVFDIQDEISSAIVEHLQVTLLAGETRARGKRPTDDPEAYNLYLKGLYFGARPGPESFEKALDFFGRALERDPEFAPAHAGIAFVFAGMGAINLAPATEIFPKARAAAERALALDPESALGHAVVAAVQYYLDLDWPAAERSFRRSLELDPSGTIARGQHAWLLLSLKRFDEATAEIHRALALDPLMPILYAWSVGIHGAAGKTDEALEDFVKLQQIDPTLGLGYFHAAMACFRHGDYDRAIEILGKGAQYASSHGWGDELLLLCRIRKGDRAGAEEIHARLLEARKTIAVSSVTMAYCFAVLGDLDRAFEWLETAVRERDSVITVINVYTDFCAPELARDPRFGALLDRLGLPR
jgi:TolB-like protein/Tfp pilus assembly protein PilF/predicted Ser/Thr protein kinase